MVQYNQERSDIIKKRIEVAIILILTLVIILNANINTNVNQTKPISTTLYSGVAYETNNILSQYKIVEVQNIEIELEQESCQNFIIKEAPNNNSFKGYMDAKWITDKTSDQYALKQYYEISDIGVWTVDGRYCIAMGSYYTTTIGTKIDIVMKNGYTIECILADCKADEHTDITNRQNPNGCMVEFVVNELSLTNRVRYTFGDLSYSNDERLYGEIDYVIIYE